MHLPKSQVPVFNKGLEDMVDRKSTAYNFALSKLTCKLQTIKVSFYCSDVQNKNLPQLALDI